MKPGPSCRSEGMYADDYADLSPEHLAIVRSVTGRQHRKLLAYLCRHGRTSCASLELACDVRSVTSRMAELVDKRLPIVVTTGRVFDSDGVVRRVTYYEVRGPAPQRDLFDDQ